MKIVVNALVESVNAIVSVALVILLIWLMFSIIGVSMFADKLGGYCDIENIYGVGKFECEKNGNVWKMYNWSFANAVDGIVTLFVISSLEGWPNIMYSIIDAGTEETGPIKDSNLNACWYFVGFVMVGSFFLVNLFIGVIGFNFTEQSQ